MGRSAGLVGSRPLVPLRSYAILSKNSVLTFRFILKFVDSLLLHSCGFVVRLFDEGSSKRTPDKDGSSWPPLES